MDSAMITTRWDQKHSSFGVLCESYIRGFTVASKCTPPPAQGALKLAWLRSGYMKKKISSKMKWTWLANISYVCHCLRLKKKHQELNSAKYDAYKSMCAIFRCYKCNKKTFSEKKKVSLDQFKFFVYSTTQGFSVTYLYYDYEMEIE